MYEPCRILLAYRNHDLQHRLTTALRQIQNWQICAEASTGHEAVSLALSIKPDVVVLDLALPGLHGLEVTRRIKAKLPRTEILALTSLEASDLTRDVLASGAQGYLLQSEIEEKLVLAIDALSQHFPFLTSDAAQRILETYTRRKHDK